MGDSRSERTPGFNDLIDLCEALDVSIDVFVPPERARQPVTALLRATAERLASSELTPAIDALLAEAETAQMPETELSVAASQPSYAANELLEKAGVDARRSTVHALAAGVACSCSSATFPMPSAALFTHEAAR